jgi:hypothetical protein
LVQPTGMDRRVNQDHVWVAILKALHGSGTAVSRTVVDLTGLMPSAGLCRVPQDGLVGGAMGRGWGGRGS